METLNIDYHIKRLLLIAKARYKKKEEQAKALGITSRTLLNYNKKYFNNEREAGKENEKNSSSHLSGATTN